MERLKSMKDCLIAEVQGQMGNLTATDTHELGEVIDMIKDLSETEYYCEITKAMKSKEQDSENRSRGMGREMERERYYTDGRMYYDGQSSGRGSYNSNYDNRGRMNYSNYPMEMRDYREGRSGMSRRNYMESKEMHHDKTKQMQELEQYMQELSGDVTEMIQDASPEEKAILQQRLSRLIDKIQ